jgi:hypothetical protein
MKRYETFYVLDGRKKNIEKLKMVNKINFLLKYSKPNNTKATIENTLKEKTLFLLEFFNFSSSARWLNFPSNNNSKAWQKHLMETMSRNHQMIFFFNIHFGFSRHNHSTFAVRDKYVKKMEENVYLFIFCLLKLYCLEISHHTFFAYNFPWYNL